jgi:hypothetical protein
MLSCITLYGCSDGDIHSDEEIPAAAEHTLDAAADSIPPGLIALKEAYPETIDSVSVDSIFFHNGTVLPFGERTIPDDYSALSEEEFELLLDNATIADMFAIPYPKGELKHDLRKNEDPGRIRNAGFFIAMYGSSEAEVRKNVVSIKWLPGKVNISVRITKINGIDEKLKAVSDELLGLPAKYDKYLNVLGGAFLWRFISGTNRLSSHSFGIAIDINGNYANYWRWRSTRKNGLIVYENNVPYEIVELFEKHGFIWGGKWYHYDTMHFEYRPELLTE